MDGDVGFRNVQLLKSRVLGVGSYGQVCEAMADNLLCAAKIFHQTLLGPSYLQPALHDANPRAPFNRFKQECALLRRINHPNIVQYLGLSQDPDTQLPVLLMELMDRNLKQLLETSTHPVLYYLQVNLSLDIIQALSFLHANSLIHRDLSSNNILLNGDSRAKLSDFGMTKMISCALPSSQVSHTTCPGTEVYMPPEATSSQSDYSDKGDVFSFGVNLVQILTKKFPSPGSMLRTVRTNDPQFPSGEIEVRTSEIDRRDNHIRLIFPGHPLLPMAIDCLRDKANDRPSASSLCHTLTELKVRSEYKESVSMNLVITVETKCEQHTPLQIIQDLAAKDQEIKDLKMELKSSQRNIEMLEQKIADKDHLLLAKDNLLQVKGTVLEKFKSKIEQLRLRLDILDVQLPTPNITPSVKKSDKEFGFHWTPTKTAPCRLYRVSNSCVLVDTVAYFMPESQLPSSRKVYALDLVTVKWSTKAECPTESASLVVIAKQLVTIGGKKQFSLKDLLGSGLSNQLYTLGSDGEWTEQYPPMPTPRMGACAVSTVTTVIVAGGKGKKDQCFKTVEIMDISTRQWFTAPDLPVPQYEASIVICRDTLYLTGGCDHFFHPLPTAFSCSLLALIQTASLPPVLLSRSSREVWTALPDLPVLYSTCACIGGHLVAIGGCNANYKPTSAVHTYDPAANVWKIVSHLGVPRERSFVLTLSEDKLLVAGGYMSKSAEGYTDRIEVGTVV
ncbi:uncharacterized protein LOC135340726 [Halichondria panicea]|uniref:uncharacterized protein LOC135340726 n=1 Tax=Halichondria panicea TaxID=6063 RepID=UPI00312B3BD6